VKGEGIVLNEPSVVAMEKATSKIKGIGLEAKRMLGRTPEGIVAVRPLKDGVIADVDVTEIMLRYFLRDGDLQAVPEAEADRGRGRAQRASRSWSGARCGERQRCRGQGGVHGRRADGGGHRRGSAGGDADRQHGHRHRRRDHGDRGDRAQSGIVSDTSIRVGGDEIDMAIVSFLRKNYNLMIGEPTAEAIKIQIGSAFNSGDEREMEVKGRDLVSGIPKTVRVHSQEIRECIQEPIQQIVEAVRRALEITPPELASDIVDRGIVMTGGGALIRGLDLLIAHETDLPIHVDEEPLTCVVRGRGGSSTTSGARESAGRKRELAIARRVRGAGR
jgi:rod shape-determining protein MreB and related proteins